MFLGRPVPSEGPRAAVWVLTGHHEVIITLIIIIIITVTRSFTSACSLVNSGMVDIITLNTDHRGKMLGFGLSAADPAPSPGLRYRVYTQSIMKISTMCVYSRDTFKTKLQVSGSEPGPAPDTTAFIQRLEEEKRRQEKGEVRLESE